MGGASHDYRYQELAVPRSEAPRSDTQQEPRSQLRNKSFRIHHEGPCILDQTDAARYLRWILPADKAVVKQNFSAHNYLREC